jgi:hypothetical protein
MLLRSVSVILSSCTQPLAPPLTPSERETIRAGATRMACMSVRRQEGGTHAAEDLLQVRTVRIIGHGGVQILSHTTRRAHPSDAPLKP